MVFSSNVFLLYFMPGFFLLYFLLPKKARNHALLLASLLFYAWGAPDFLIQLVVSTIANFYLVKAMVAAKETENGTPKGSPTEWEVKRKTENGKLFFVPSPSSFRWGCCSISSTPIS